MGLGNPGDQYENTRHNLGFVAVDRFRDEMNFSAWQEKFKAEISEENFNDEKIILAKPGTFMNLSGQAVREIINFYKLPADDLLIIHDDLDLPLGSLRFVKNSGAAGHNGIKSIIESLGTQNFARLRLGIKPIKNSFFSSLFKTPAEKFVLQKFSAKEANEVKKMTEQTTQAIKTYLAEGLEKAQTRFN